MRNWKLLIGLVGQHDRLLIDRVEAIGRFLNDRVTLCSRKRNGEQLDLELRLLDAHELDDRVERADAGDLSLRCRLLRTTGVVPSFFELFCARLDLLDFTADGIRPLGPNVLGAGSSRKTRGERGDACKRFQDGNHRYPA